MAPSAGPRWCAAPASSRTNSSAPVGTAVGTIAGWRRPPCRPGSPERAGGAWRGIAIFDQNDRGPLPQAEHYEARLQLAEFDDRAGFDTYHVSEHHATPLSATPATGAWLAAIAQRTRRLRFGPLVYICRCAIPCSRRRDLPARPDERRAVELGIGRGISPYELGYRGVDAAEAPARYREAFALLMRR